MKPPIPLLILALSPTPTPALTTDTQAIALLNGGLPPCGQKCYTATAQSLRIDPNDIITTCNDPTFNRVVGPCQLQCPPEDVQAIEAVIGIACGTVGGASRALFPDTVPGSPACANNCSATAQLVSGCVVASNATCFCRSPDVLNAYGPCVAAGCGAADRVRSESAFADYCASVGGLGPYDRDEILGYLRYSHRNESSVRLYDGSATRANATVSAPLVRYTGAAGGLVRGCVGVWVLGALGVGVTVVVGG